MNKEIKNKKQVIVVSTHKGGCGKTTLATNLAVELTKRNKLVCVIDTDGQAGCNIIFGLDPKAFNETALIDYLSLKKENPDLSVSNFLYKVESVNNLVLLPASEALSCFDHLYNKNRDLTDNFIEVINDLKKVFDYIIIDTAPSVSTLTLTTLKTADAVLLPFEPEQQNAQGVLTILEYLKQDKITNGRQITKIVAPFKFKPKGVLDQKVYKFLKDTIDADDELKDCYLTEKFISFSNQYRMIPAKLKVPLTNSPSQAQTVLKLKEQFSSLTDEIMELLNK